MIIGLIIFYMGLQLMDLYFHLEWKEFSVGILFISLTLTILFLLKNDMVGSLIWFIISLIEYLSFLKKN